MEGLNIQLMPVIANPHWRTILRRRSLYIETHHLHRRRPRRPNWLHLPMSHLSHTWHSRHPQLHRQTLSLWFCLHRKMTRTQLQWNS